MDYTIRIEGNADDGIVITCIDHKDNDASWKEHIPASDLEDVDPEDEDEYVRNRITTFLEQTVELSYTEED